VSSSFTADPPTASSTHPPRPTSAGFPSPHAASCPRRCLPPHAHHDRQWAARPGRLLGLLRRRLLRLCPGRLLGFLRRRLLMLCPSPPPSPLSRCSAAAAADAWRATALRWHRASHPPGTCPPRRWGSSRMERRPRRLGPMALRGATARRRGGAAGKLDVRWIRGVARRLGVGDGHRCWTGEGHELELRSSKARVA
jgi:hypothetical protein